MSQTSNEIGPISLPPPPSEQIPLPSATPETPAQPVEQAPARPEQASQPAPPAPMLFATDLPPTTSPQAQTNNTTDVTSTTNSSSSKIIEDTDLIEKEWVDKAKRIVERNRDNPYKQSEELTEFRADYMKKIYNKTIKIDK